VFEFWLGDIRWRCYLGVCVCIEAEFQKKKKKEEKNTLRRKRGVLFLLKANKTREKEDCESAFS
jgi:hypothetical protein